MQLINGIGFKPPKLRQRLKSLYTNSLYRNAVYLILHSSVQALLGFIFWLMAARLYTAEDVGRASAALSAVALISVLAFFGLGTGLIRYLPAAGGDANRLLNSVFTSNAFFAILISAVFILGLEIWSPGLVFLGEQPIYSFAFIGFTVVTSLAGIENSAFVATKRAEFALIQSFIYSITKLILVVLLAQFFGTFGIFAATGIGYVVAVSVGLLIFFPRIIRGYFPLPGIQINILKGIIKFSFSNYIAAIFETAPALVLPIMFVNLLGAEQTAYFFITWSIASLLNAIGSSTSLSIFAEGSNNDQITLLHMWQSLKFILILLVPATILLIFLSDKLLLLFGNAYAQGGQQLLVLLAVTALPLSINSIYFSKKKVEKDMKPVVLFTGLITAITLGLSYLLLAEYGLLAAGIAWLIANITTMLIIVSINLQNIIHAYNCVK